jgi:hypothetical protein
MGAHTIEMFYKVLPVGCKAQILLALPRKCSFIYLSDPVSSADLVTAFGACAEMVGTNMNPVDHL